MLTVTDLMGLGIPVFIPAELLLHRFILPGRFTRLEMFGAGTLGSFPYGGVMQDPILARARSPYATSYSGVDPFQFMHDELGVNLEDRHYWLSRTDFVDTHWMLRFNSTADLLTKLHHFIHHNDTLRVSLLGRIRHEQHRRVLLSIPWMIQRLMGWDSSENPLIEFLYDPKTGNPSKAVVDVEAFHRRQAAAFHGILRVLGTMMEPQDIEKLIRMDEDAEPVKPTGLRERPIKPSTNGVQPHEEHSVAKLAIEGARISVPSSRVPFLIGSDSDECHFDISFLMDFSDRRTREGDSLVHSVHCGIDRNPEGGGWILRNYGGGTFVDGTAVTEEAIITLRPGSQIQIHHLTFIFFPIEE
ncbi:hypothetical protein FOL47_001705 [Perkinsus chesapeaki]|uniref:FHA domain-containing protein n=1 Tax=Perkinsus chesapeaki TaxID=330153 RepID=A0A7J6KSH4_PERCH|nr:hypothetical protein FOL47_001705 [Perkinsus chesapeaki]